MIIPALLIALASSGCMRSPEQKSARFMEAGRKLLEQKDPARAILQFRNAAQATPNSAEVYYQLGQAFLATGDLRQGVAALRKAVDLNPKHELARLRLAQLMAGVNDRGVLHDAQERLQTLLQESPDNPDALHALALTELKLGDSEEAVKNLQLAMLAAPQQLRVALTLAQAKLAQQDSKGAEEVLKKVSENAPKSATAHNVLADFYFSQKRMPEAESELRHALKIDPKNGPALLALARLRLINGRNEEAEQDFKQLASLPGDESIYASFLSQEGRNDEALREFERLARERPNDRQARTNLVAAYQRANRLADAKEILSDVLKKNPKD